MEKLHPPWLAELSETEIARLLVKVLTEGVGGTRGAAGGGFLIESFLPLLRERGAEDALIDTLTRENPGSLFE